MNPTRWSFHTRLTTTIAIVFVAAGAALLAVQYLALHRVVDGAVGSVSLSTLVDGSQACVVVGADLDVADGCPTVDPDPATGSDPAVDAVSCVSGDDGPPICTDASGNSVPPPDELVARDAAAQADAGGQGGGTGEGDDSTQWGSAQLEGIVQATGVIVGRDVLRGALGWSALLLVGFAAVAAVAASWLSRRSLGRIAEVTAVARRIEADHLTNRLALAGPHDEIRELGDTLDAMFDRLAESFGARDRFVANASHELRTPLTTTRAALEIPLAQGRVPDDLVPALERALAANRRSERLVAALLTLARGRSEVDQERADVDLADLVERTLAELAPLAAGSRVTVDVRTSPAPVRAHPVLVEQLVRNLLDNAIRHNVAGGRVLVDVGREADAVVLTVGNDGPALDPDRVDRLTEPFHRGDASRRPAPDGGLGLGLAVVRDIVAAHGWRLSLTAREAGGLDVRVRAPAA